MNAERLNKIFLRLTMILCFLACTFFPRASNSQEELIAEWWNDNMLIAEGYGFPKEGVDNKKIARRLAYRAAVADAYRNLAEQASKIQITAGNTVGSEVDAGNIVEKKVDAVIKGAEVLSEDYDEDDTCAVVMRVPLYGVKNSVARIAFKRVPKEDFPPPSEDSTAEVAGNYTGLIIDCGDADLTPVLSPEILNEDAQAIYSSVNLDYDKLVSKGMIGYEKKSDEESTPEVDEESFFTEVAGAESKTSRAGNNPLVIKAQTVSDDNSCPVISAEDADKILRENQSSHFLDEGAVVFTSYRIGGVRA